MKQRLDLVLVERSLAPSRTIAAAMIMARQVKTGERILDKPGLNIDTELELTVTGLPRYASRGGDKLASVAGELGLDPAGRVVLDVGSSTGGFTDYCLQHGATKIYCVDAGSNQLAYKLRGDERVVVMERTDIREVGELPEKPDLAVIDVSFIALSRVLAATAQLISSDAIIYALMKPQFQAGKDIADRFKGIISDENVRQNIIADFETLAADDFEILGAADSAVHGAEGNRERFYALRSKH